MDSNKIKFDDARLTAFVLGELDETDREQIEQQLQSCEETRMAVDEIRKTVQLLEVHLANEPALELTAEQRGAIEAACLNESSAVVDTRVATVPQKAKSPEIRSARKIMWILPTVATVVVVALVVTAIQNSDEQNELSVAVSEKSGRYDDEKLAAKTGPGNVAPRDLAQVDWALEPSKSGESGNSDGDINFVSTSGNRSEKGKFENSKSFDFRGNESSGKGVNVDADVKGLLDELQDQSSVRSKSKVYRQSGQSGSGKNLPADAAKKLGARPAQEPESFDGKAGGGGQGQPERVPSTLNKHLAGEGKPAPISGSSADGAQSESKFSGGGGVAAGKKVSPTNARGIQIGQPSNQPHPPSVASIDRAKDQYGADRVDTLKAGVETTKELVLYRKRIREYYRQLQEIRGKKPAKKPAGGETYTPIVENQFLSPVSSPLSTLSIDVDTASYSNVRRFLTRYQWPNPDAVRIEEMLNYFNYDYPQPEDETPFSVNIEVAACPWQTGHRLARIGLKGKEILRDQRPPSNLVFLLDVSGSMRDANKLPLVKSSMEMLVNEMTEDDRIAIVTYSGQAGVRLASTSGAKKDVILKEIRGLKAGGSTNGEAGMKLAYDQALNHFIKDGTNRIIMCTDGDFNVGVSDDNELVRMIKNKVRSGVFLSIFGFGMGNLKDSKLEKLADKGNGHYGYIDNISEAKKVFIEEMTGMLYTIAKDVKVQVEFNPAKVGAYRLIGYENRVMAAQDFNNDRKDAGDIGAGHTATALYEIIPPDKLPPVPTVDDLKYQPKKKGNDNKPKTGEEEKPAQVSDELFTVKLNYKKPDEDKSQRLKEYPVKDQADGKKAPMTRDFQWAATVASFGMLLRESPHSGQANFDQVLEMALASKGDDKSGYRRELVDLVLFARTIRAREKGLPTEVPKPLALDAGRVRAKVGTKYSKLLKTIEAPSDWERYGSFNDYGFWSGDKYGTHTSLPEAYWVYVYPNWYLWETETAAIKR